MSYFEKEPELPDDEPKSTGRRWLIGLAVVLILGIAGGAVYWRMAVARAAEETPTLEEAEIRAKAAALDTRLQAIREALGNLGANGSLEMEKALVEEAVTRQNELMRLRPSADGEDAIRLHEWQTRLDDLNVSAWGRESRDLEEHGSMLLSQKKYAEAVQNFKQALDLQRQINSSFAKQSLKNFSRESRLQQDVERLEAEPLQAEVQAALASARRAAAESRWDDAVRDFEQARELQQKLNRDYARSRFANTLAVEQIEAELATLGATEAHNKIVSFRKEAAELAAAGKLDEAEARLTQAVEQQRVINEQFAKSRFVSMERFEEIEIERQTLRARAAFDEVRRIDVQASEHLRRRELFQAQKLVSEALKSLESTTVLFPKAGGIDDEVKQRLNYLNLRQAELVQIQDQLYELLAPLPGSPRVALLKTEVPQALFSRVMNSNPSRNPGRQLPVDSVTYPEAEEFCRRLGWVLGLVVRLPSEREFVAAAGELRAAAAQSWMAANSAGKSQPTGQKPANAAGFHDLLGNVGEWVAGGEGDKAVVAGGSYTEALDGVERVPVKIVPKGERARSQGFRVVVEIDLAAPAAK